MKASKTIYLIYYHYSTSHNLTFCYNYIKWRATMKYILLLLMLTLTGCVTQREKELSNINFEISIELLKTQEKLSLYSEPENIVKPLMIRKYKTDDGENLNILAPKDGLISIELEYKFKQLNDKQLIICDNSYWLPSREFVVTKLLPMYRTVNLIPYSDKFDCDDFSRFFSSYAHAFYMRVVINKTMESMAVAEIHYQQKSSVLNMTIANKPLNVPWYIYEKHAINCIVLDDMSLMFIEPQSGLEVRLTDEELKSIYFAKF